MSINFTKAGINLNQYINTLGQNQVTSTGETSAVADTGTAGTTDFTDGASVRELNEMLEKYDTDGNKILDKNEIKNIGEEDTAFKNFLISLSQTTIQQSVTGGGKVVVQHNGALATYFDKAGSVTKTIERTPVYAEDETTITNYEYTITEFKENEKIVTTYKGPAEHPSPSNSVEYYHIRKNQSTYQMISEDRFPKKIDGDGCTDADGDGYIDTASSQSEITGTSPNLIKTTTTKDDSGNDVTTIVDVKYNGTIKNGAKQIINTNGTIKINILSVDVNGNATIRDGSDQQVITYVQPDITCIDGHWEVKTEKVNSNGEPYQSMHPETTEIYAHEDYDGGTTIGISSSATPIATVTAYKRGDTYITTTPRITVEPLEGATKTTAQFLSADGTTINRAKPQTVTVEYEATETEPAHKDIITITYTDETPKSVLTRLDEDGNTISVYEAPGHAYFDASNFTAEDNPALETYSLETDETTGTITRTSRYSDGETVGAINYMVGVGFNYQTYDLNGSTKLKLTAEGTTANLTETATFNVQDGDINFWDASGIDKNHNGIFEESEIRALSKENRAALSGIINQMIENGVIQVNTNTETGITTIKQNNGNSVSYVDKDNNLTKTIEKTPATGGGFTYKITEYSNTPSPGEKIVKEYKTTSSKPVDADRIEQQMRTNSTNYQMVSEKHYTKLTGSAIKGRNDDGEGYNKNASLSSEISGTPLKKVTTTDGKITIVNVKNNGTVQSGSVQTEIKHIAADARNGIEAHWEVTELQVKDDNGTPYNNSHTVTVSTYSSNPYNEETKIFNSSIAPSSTTKTPMRKVDNEYVIDTSKAQTVTEGNVTTAQYLNTDGKQNYSRTKTITISYTSPAHKDIITTTYRNTASEGATPVWMATSILTQKDANNRITAKIKGPEVGVENEYKTVDDFGTPVKYIETNYYDTSTPPIVQNIKYDNDGNIKSGTKKQGGKLIEKYETCSDKIRVITYEDDGKTIKSKVLFDKANLKNNLNSSHALAVPATGGTTQYNAINTFTTTGDKVLKKQVITENNTTYTLAGFDKETGIPLIKRSGSSGSYSYKIYDTVERKWTNYSGDIANYITELGDNIHAFTW